jgi:hypothetical protein
VLPIRKDRHMTHIRKISSFLLPSIADMLFLVIFLCLTFSIGNGLLRDTDTGYHIRAGEYILNTHTIPHHDIFSYITPPLPWTAHEWLSEVIMGFLHINFGLTGVVIFFALLLSCTYYFLFRMLRSEKGNFLLAVIIALLVVASSMLHWHARPHIFSIVLTLGWYYILDGFQNDRKNILYLLPLLMLFWVNLHGGFITGFVLLAVYMIGNLAGCRDAGERAGAVRKLKLLGIITLVSLVACLINPFGYHILLFPFNVVGNRYLMDHVQEFISPNFHDTMPFKYMLLLLITFLGVSARKLSLIELLLILIFLNMSLFSVRYIPLFAIIAAPILVRYGNSLLEKLKVWPKSFLETRGERFAALDSASRWHLWPVVGLVVVVFLAASGQLVRKFDPKLRPTAAVEFLKKEPIKGNMFNNDQFGSYIIYSAWPQYKVFFDGRSDMYGVKRMKEYFNVLAFKPGWEKIIDKYHISWIIYNADSELCRYLLLRPDWKLIYADKVANIFVKNVPENQYLIERYKDVKPISPEPGKDDSTE